MKNNELNQVMKSNVPKFLIIGLLAILVLLTLLLYVFFRFSPMFIVQSSGYAINNKTISRTLQSENPEDSEKKVKLLSLNENDTIYKRLSSYYIGGEKKKEINLNYPVYLVNNASVLNLSKDMTLFTNTYEEVGGYPNFTISDGKMYNQGDLTRTDTNEYLFLKNKDNIFCSLKELNIKTVLNDYTIPLNSIINFNEDYISYYKFISNDEIEYETIRDIDLNSKATINGEEDTYENLLIKLKIIKVEEEVEKMVYNYDEENMVVQENSEEEEEEETEETSKKINEKDENDDGVRVIDNRKKVNNTAKAGTSKSSSNSTKTIKTDPNYVTPEVSCTDLIPNVYTATTNLRIYDPSGAITQAVEFTFYDETGKVFNRVSALSGGTLIATGLKPSTYFYVEGTYTYTKETGEKAIKTFYTGEIETKSLSSLDTIDLSFKNGEVFSDKIELVDMKINNELTSEVLFGLSKISVIADGNTYNVKSGRLRELLRGDTVNFESDNNIRSNQVVRYEVKAFDRFGNQLKLSKNGGETRTSKKAPYLLITPNTRDLMETKLKISQVNADRVEIENFRYTIYNSDGTEIKTEHMDNIPDTISVRNLNPNNYYIIRTYGDYNLKDGKGLYQNIILGETKFTTLPISSLGLVYYNVTHSDTTFSSNKITMKIDSRKTDSRLSGILTYAKVKIMMDGQEVTSKTLEEEEIVRLIAGEEIEYEPNNLDSKTDYRVEIETKATLGTETENIKTNIDYPTFKTSKKSAKVEIKNDFVTGEMIDFDVRIVDEDGAVLDNVVSMELRDSNRNLLAFERINTNEDFKRLIYTKLDANKNYTITFTALEYNETDSGSTFKSNYELETWEIFTEEGISGKIQLTDLNKKEKQDSKNLVDMSTETKWYVYPNFNTSDYYGKQYDEVNEILTIGGYGNNRRCVYDLREYAGRTVTISFKAKSVYTSQYKTGRYFIQNAKTDKNRTEFTSRVNQNDWSNYSQTVTIDESGFLGFYVQGGSGLQIKELQVELGTVQTPYKKYDYFLDLHLLVNLTDLRGEIETKDYYIKTYRDGELIQTDRYEEIGDDNKVTDAIKQYTLEENKEYRFDLVIRIRDRDYVLDTQEVDTPRGKEIRGIYSLDDYLLIQPYGNYIVFCDLDLSLPSLRFGYTWDETRVCFDGTLDFNGYTVTRQITQNNNYGMFGFLGKHAVVKNLVLDVKINNNIEMVEFYGIFYGNYGTVENIRVNLLESTAKLNVYTELIGYVNRGTINKFIINTQVPYYTNNRSSCGVWNNYGTIKNGYLYGEPIRIIGPTTENYSYERNVAGLVCTSSGAAYVHNVYSLISIEFDENQSDNGKEKTANIIRTNQAYVDNIYSVGVGNAIQTNGGPSIFENSGKINECYYFADKVFGNNYNKKTTKLALVDSQFQNLILNSEGAYNVDEMIGNGFYPQLYMSDCMPRQSFLPLPEVKDEDLPDLLSCKVLEQGSDRVKVEFIINNPSGEILVNNERGGPGIEVQYLDTTIESQEYEDGKSRVVATLSNPKKYVSSYNVLSITLQGAFTRPYTRNYATNERIINVDLYREIYNTTDWKNIPSHLDENYMLMNDLDFNMEANTISITRTYTGKLEGRDPSGTIHTISRIRSNRGLFYQVKGKISNLNIDTYTNLESETVSTGLIEELKGGIIDNVHVKNIVLRPKSNRKGGDFQGGGIAGLADGGAMIKNSSVTNPNISVEEKISTIRIGGLVGYASTAIINNVFVRDANLNVKYNIYSDGVGGLVGRTNPAYITNCYTTGKLFCDGDRNGGVVGYASTSGIIERCYSTVEVTSYGDYNGGIVGFNLLPVSCISIGNIYTRLGTENLHRVSGYSVTRKVNYAYKDQKLNGYTVEEDLDAYLFTEEELYDRLTYLNTIKWDDNYNYDGIEEGYLPKLTYLEDHTKILPNQEQGIKINEDNGIHVVDIRIDDRQPTYAKIRITLSNPNELQINNIGIENMNITIDNNGIYNQEGKTYIDLIARPEKYYDSYKIEAVYYQENGENKSVVAHGRLECRFYKQIYSVEQWQDICKGDDKDTYQNYMIMNDLNFRGTPYEDRVNYCITAGRIETQGESESEMVTIKGITLKNVSQQEGLIQKVSVNIQNIKFEDIHIYTGNNSGNNVGVIRRTEGNMKDIIFKNISIYGGDGTEATPTKSKLSYVGCVSTVNSETINIEVQNVSITGVNYVGGYAGTTVNLGANIKGNNINVEASGNYIGGLVGSNSAGLTHYHQDIRIDNSQISGNNYVGGIGGQTPSMVNGTVHGDTPTVDGEGNKVYKMTVTGVDYVGGIAGNLQDGRDGGAILVENTKIKGNKNVGGAGGYSSDWWASVKRIINCYIDGASNVGGVYGDCRAMCNSIYSIDNVVKGSGDNVGGIAGYLNPGNNTTSYWVVENGKIDGASYVGGLVGYSRSGRIHNSYSNATVKASGNYAGGAVGYLNNSEMTAATLTSGLMRVMVLRSNVSAMENVGGIYGGVQTDFYMPSTFSHSWFVDAEVNCLSTSKHLSSMIIGSPKSRNSDIENVYIYAGSRLNSNIPTPEDDNISINQLWTLDQLKDQNTYTILDSSWVKNTVTSGLYPIVNSNTEYQRGIALPPESSMPTNSTMETDSTMVTAATTSIERSNSANSKLYERTDLLIGNMSISKLLPEYICYPVSVDEFNIDFTRTDDTAILKLTVDGEEKVRENITQKTYTFKYDYISKIGISIEQGLMATISTISPEQVRRSISLVGNDKYYLVNGKLICNGQEVDGEYANLYGDYALTSSGNKLNLSSRSIEKAEVDNIVEITQTKPIEYFTYDGNIISTYGTYSIVNGNLKTQSYFVKNNKLSIIDDSVNYKIGNYIIDSYNGNEYQTILGTDGKLMDLKQQIKYPKHFYNSEIKEIATNESEDKKDILIMYNNGNVVNFDYTSGTQEFEDGEKSDIGLVDYLKENLLNTDNIYSELVEKYEKSLEVQLKLEQTPIEELLNNNGEELNGDTDFTKQNYNNTSNSNRYTTVYNANTKEYDIYKEDKLLNSEEEKVTPETEIIKTTEVLSRFYLSGKAETVQDNDKNGIIYFGISIIAIGITLVLLNRNNSKKKSKKKIKSNRKG